MKHSIINKDVEKAVTNLFGLLLKLEERNRAMAELTIPAKDDLRVIDKYIRQLEKETKK